MGDPDRILPVLTTVEKLWRLYPDWRLGQLLCNVASWTDPAKDAIWNLGDSELIAQIERHLAQDNQAQPPANQEETKPVSFAG